MSAAPKEDGLFLLEVLVDKVTFHKSPCMSDKEFKTCVQIACPSVAPLEICDDESDGTARSEGPFTKTFNNGKSCLFSLQESDIQKAMSNFPLSVSVTKSLPCGCLPASILLGETKIDMTKEFVQAHRKYTEDPTSVSYEALKDNFRLFGNDGSESGTINMFLRISCFGNLIVTKFQGTGGPPKLGGSKSPGIIDRSCTPKRGFHTEDDPCACGAHQGGGHDTQGKGSTQACKEAQRTKLGICPMAGDPRTNMPCESEDPCYCSGPRPKFKEPLACRNTEPYCLHVPKGRNRQFEEIDTNISGNELKIKVPAQQAIIKRISQTHCSLQSPYAGKSKDGGPCVPPCAKNQLTLVTPKEPVCCEGPPLAQTMFSCTTEGCAQVARHNQQAALCVEEEGEEKVMLPNVDVFVLRVARTSTLGEKRHRLEVEVAAPKAGEKPIIAEKVNSMIQSSPNCICCTKRLKSTKLKRRKCC